MELYNPEIKCKKCGHDKHSVHYQGAQYGSIDNVYEMVQDERLEVICLKCGYVDEYEPLQKDEYKGCRNKHSHVRITI